MSAPPPPLWERASAASPYPSAYRYSRLNSILLYYSEQYQNAQGRTRPRPPAMMHDRRRAGGISCVLLARAILYKVCPAFGIVRGGFSLARFCADQGELARIAGRTAFCRSGFSPEFWRFFSRIALCSLCTIMPLRFVQVYKVCYLCKMLLTICGKCAKIQTVRDQHTPRQPEGPAEERSGGTVRTLARGNAPGGPTLQTKTD